MKVICDYSFQDGENVRSYSLKVSETFPGNAVIKNGILFFKPAKNFGGELIFSPEGLRSDTVVKITLYGAKGEGALGGTLIFKNTEYADVSGKVNVNIFNGIIFLTRDDRPFEFKGYKVELE